MADLVKNALEKLNRKGDGDLIDRLSASATVYLLIVASVLLSATTYFGPPIDCWIPAEMSEPMHQYIENFCYAQNTFYLPFDQRIKMRKPDEAPPGRVISYYQWVPFILLLQAAMFYAPRLVWRSLSYLSGVNYNAVQVMARQCLFCAVDQPNHCHRYLANYINAALDSSRAARRRASTWDCCSRFARRYLISVFFLAKALYVVNAIGQIFLLGAVLQIDDPLYGINLIRNLVNGTDWQHSGYFPRSTLCDVEIREPLSGNRHPYTVQCLLMINVVNERLFIFLWFWAMLVAVLSTLNLLRWLLQTSLPGSRRRFIRRLLPDLPADKDDPLADGLPKFADQYLGVDGVFLLRSIADRVGSIVACKVMTHIWHDFLETQASKAAMVRTEVFGFQPPRNDRSSQCDQSTASSDRVIGRSARTASVVIAENDHRMINESFPTRFESGKLRDRRNDVAGSNRRLSNGQSSFV